MKKLFYLFILCGCVLSACREEDSPVVIEEKPKVIPPPTMAEAQALLPGKWKITGEAVKFSLKTDTLYTQKIESSVGSVHEYAASGPLNGVLINNYLFNGQLVSGQQSSYQIRNKSELPYIAIIYRSTEEYQIFTISKNVLIYGTISAATTYTKDGISYPCDTRSYFRYHERVP